MHIVAYCTNSTQNIGNMTVEEFKEFVKSGRPIDTPEAIEVLNSQNDEARKITAKLNSSYHTLDEIRAILSELFGYKVPDNFRVFPPFYTDFGRNIHATMCLSTHAVSFKTKAAFGWVTVA